jgi:hypothetical protein
MDCENAEMVLDVPAYTFTSLAWQLDIGGCGMADEY